MLKRRINMQMKKPSTNPSLSQFGDTFRNGSEVLSKSKHNVLSTKLGCFYPFTSLTINDPNGFVLGVTEANQTLSPDNFNTKRKYICRLADSIICPCRSSRSKNSRCR